MSYPLTIVVTKVAMQQLKTLFYYIREVTQTLVLERRCSRHHFQASQVVVFVLIFLDVVQIGAEPSLTSHSLENDSRTKVFSLDIRLNS